MVPGDVLLVRGRHGFLHQVIATLAGGSGVSHCAVVAGDGLPVPEPEPGARDAARGLPAQV